MPIARMVTSEEALLLGGLFFAAAILYSSVGHGGASGYLASMGLVGVAPAIMRPTALVMNIAVASISLYNFTRASGFRWRLFLPFAVTSVPMAFLGGRIHLPICGQRCQRGVGSNDRHQNRAAGGIGAVRDRNGCGG